MRCHWHVPTGTKVSMHQIPHVLCNKASCYCRATGRARRPGVANIRVAAQQRVFDAARPPQFVQRPIPQQRADNTHQPQVRADLPARHPFWNAPRQQTIASVLAGG